MGVINTIKGWFKSEEVEEGLNPESSNTSYIGYGKLGYNPIEYDIFDGEKTPGELGTIYDTLPDHIGLRLRAYDLNLKTDIIKAITGKFFKWVVGTGLKLQYEPNKKVLEICGITEDPSFLKDDAEALFSLYANSNYSDYTGKDDLHKKANDAFKAAFLGGDCLCVIRVNKFGPNIQVIDGEKVETPFAETGKAEGSKIEKGIEINAKGEHVAFWVATSGEDSIVEHKRIKAKNSNGNTVAWMVYGDKHRIDHYRGVPVISSIIEKVTKLDRYVESSVKKAEETANVVYAFKHNTNSTGENILATSLTPKKSISSKETPETIFEKNGKTAAALRQSTSGTVMNLTPDSDLISLSSASETQFEAFYRAVFVSLCASVDIPEEVALQKFDQNYSSSRAAINGWEFVVEIWRNEIVKKFYKPFFKVCIEYWMLTGKLKSSAFLNAKNTKDFMALEAYYSCRFVGKKMPHIDPQKEAKAIRTMLGNSTAPLMSHEQATEALGLGDWKENYEKYEKESELIPEENDNNENNGDGNNVVSTSKE